MGTTSPKTLRSLIPDSWNIRGPRDTDREIEPSPSKGASSVRHGPSLDHEPTIPMRKRLADEGKPGRASQSSERGRAGKPVASGANRVDQASAVPSRPGTRKSASRDAGPTVVIHVAPDGRIRLEIPVGADPEQIAKLVTALRAMRR